jgi:4-amino-4-deoxy-L-arabinose transferase-like glycosyltransferase
MPTAHPRLKVIALGALLSAAAALMVAPMLLYPFGRDQGVFACGADVIRRGGALYRDFWDLKPPGIYYLFRMSFIAFGRSMLAPRLLDLFFSLATAAGLALIGRRLSSLWAGVAAGLLFLSRYALGFDYWNSAQADGFASLPLAMGVLALLAAERRRSWPLAALCGALIGAAIIIKFTLGIFILLPLAALAAARGERLGPRLARAAGYLLGCAAVVGAIVALVWRSHALGDMLAIMFAWNAQYAAIRASGLDTIVFQTWRFWFGHDHGVLNLIGLLALAGVADLVLRREKDPTRWMPAAWVAVMLAQVYVQGKYFEYHWLPALPPFCLLAGMGVAAVWGRLRERVEPLSTAKWAAGGGVAVLLLGLAAGYRSQFDQEIGAVTGRISRTTFFDSFRDRQDFSLSADLQVAQFLREHTAPGTPVFIWGFEPIVYFLADRPPASRFISQQPLVTPWSPPQWRDELIRDLARRRPEYILVLHNDVMPWVTTRPYDSAGELAYFPGLADVLERDYRPDVTIEDFEIHRRR